MLTLSKIYAVKTIRPRFKKIDGFQLAVIVNVRRLLLHSTFLVPYSIFVLNYITTIIVCCSVYPGPDPGHSCTPVILFSIVQQPNQLTNLQIMNRTILK